MRDKNEQFPQLHMIYSLLFAIRHNLGFYFTSTRREKHYLLTTEH